MIRFLINFSVDPSLEKSGAFFVTKPDSLKQIALNPHLDLFVWGDPISTKNIPGFAAGIADEAAIHNLLKSIPGHFYYLLFDKNLQAFSAGNSLFGILPLYYAAADQALILSDDPLEIAKHIGNRKINKRFILENILFNYPLTNQSCVVGIHLLPANSFIHYTHGTSKICKHTCMENYYSARPRAWKKSLHELSDLFIERSEKYFPDEISLISLTGGFDGRTLTACGLMHKKSIATYSFGSDESEDVQIASKLSAQANIPFHCLALNEAYVKNDSLSAGLEFIDKAAGTAAFARAHYLYAVKKLTKLTPFIVTGNFGSEIFRTAHSAGPVINHNLYSFFNSKNCDEAIAGIKNSTEFDWLNKDAFKNEWDALIEDLRQLPRFNRKYDDLSTNQRFYITVFEEILRKYFGAEMVNQFYYLNNRTPFLDFEFFIRILQTELSGVYSGFYEQNPIKRFKGQILYSHIIRKAWPSFGKNMTDKGYCPDDLQGMAGKIRIAKAYFNKKYFRKGRNSYDPYAVQSAFRYNSSFFKSIRLDKELFNLRAFGEAFEQVNMSNGFFIGLSQAFYYNKLRDNLQ